MWCCRLGVDCCGHWLSGSCFVCVVGCQGAVWCGVVGWELIVVGTGCQGAVLCVLLGVRELFGVVL